MTDPAQVDAFVGKLRATAFDAIEPALEDWGEYLPIGARQTVADAVLKAVYLDIVAANARVREQLTATANAPLTPGYDNSERDVREYARDLLATLNDVLATVEPKEQP